MNTRHSNVSTTKQASITHSTRPLRQLWTTRAVTGIDRPCGKQAGPELPAACPKSYAYLKRFWTWLNVWYYAAASEFGRPDRSVPLAAYQASLEAVVRGSSERYPCWLTGSGSDRGARPPATPHLHLLHLHDPLAGDLWHANVLLPEVALTAPCPGHHQRSLPAVGFGWACERAHALFQTLMVMRGAASKLLLLRQVRGTPDRTPAWPAVRADSPGCCCAAGRQCRSRGCRGGPGTASAGAHAPRIAAARWPQHQRPRRPAAHCLAHLRQRCSRAACQTRRQQQAGRRHGAGSDGAGGSTRGAAAASHSGPRGQRRRRRQQRRTAAAQPL